MTEWVIQMMVQYPQYAGLAIVGPYIVGGVVSAVVLVMALIFSGHDT